MARIPTDRKYKLPPSRLQVHFGAQGPRIQLRNKTGKVIINHATMKEFVAAYNTTFNGNYDALYTKWDENTADEYIKSKMWLFPGASTNERKTNRQKLTEIYDEFVNRQKYWLEHKSKLKKQRGRPKQSESSTVEASESPSTESESIASTESQSHSSQAAAPQPVSSSPPESHSSVANLMPSTTGIVTRSRDPLVLLNRLQETVEQCVAKLDAYHESNQSVITTLKNYESRMTRFETNMDKLIRREANHRYHKAKYAKQEKGERKVAEFDELEERQQQRRVGELHKIQKQLVGDSNVGMLKILKRQMKAPRFVDVILNDEAVQSLHQKRQQKMDMMKRNDVGNKYHELYIMCGCLVGSNKSDRIRLQREYRREYRYDAETDTFYLSRPMKNGDVQSIMVPSRCFHDVIEYLFRVDPIHRTPLSPHFYTEQLLEKAAYIVYVRLMPLLRWRLYEMHTHKVYVNNTCIPHALRLRQWFDEQIKKIEPTETATVYPCAQSQLEEDEYKVDGKRVTISGGILFVGLQYDATSDPPCVPDSELSHMQLATLNVLNRGLIQLILCMFPCLLSAFFLCDRSPATHPMAAIGNVKDGSDVWIRFMREYMKDIKSSRVEALVMHDDEWRVYAAYDIVLALCTDLSAAAPANGAPHNAQTWLCILTVGAGTDTGDKLHVYDGDKIAMEWDTNWTTKRNYVILQHLSYDEVVEAKAANKLADGKRVCTEVPGGFRRQIDLYRDELAEQFKLDDPLKTDEEIKNEVNEFCERQRVPFIDHALPPLYNEQVFCGLHCAIALVKHSIIIPTTDSMRVFNLSQKDVLSVFAAFRAECKKLRISLSAQFDTIDNKIKHMGSSKLSLNMNGEIAANFKLLLPVYSKLFITEIRRYAGCKLYIASNAADHVLHYFVDIFSLLLQIAIINVYSSAFHAIFDAVATFGGNLWYAITRIFPSKLIDQVYVDFALRIFPWKLKWLIERYKVGAAAFSNQCCEHRGKELKDQCRHVQRKRIKEILANHGPLSMHNYIDQLFARILVIDIGRIDWNDLKFDLKTAREKENAMNELIQKQQEQLDAEPDRKFKVHELVFFADITAKYFDPVRSEKAPKDIETFNDYIKVFRDLKATTGLESDLKDIREEYKRKDPTTRKRDHSMMDDNDNSNNAETKSPQKKKSKVNENKKRGKKYKNKNKENKNKNN